MMRIIRNLCALIILSFIFSIFIFNTPTFANDTEIPKIFLTGDISDMNEKSDKRKLLFRYEDGDKQFNGYTKIKLQGFTSLSFQKKNYTIDLYKDDAYKEEDNIDLGWGEHNKYTLKANWTDKTHARNIVTANLAAEINKKYSLFASTPNFGEVDGYPVEVYLNGSFFGLYTLNIPKSDWMFNMDENNPNNILFSNKWQKNSNLFKTKMGFDGVWDLEVGNDEGYAVSKFNEMVDFVANSSNSEFKQKIDNYFNLDNLLNYYVLVEYAELFDNVSNNILIGTYDGSRWLLSLYDLDLSWGAQFEDILEYDMIIDTENNFLFNRLVENFPNELADRYFALRKTILTKENILNKFYEFESKIPESSLKKDQAEWGKNASFDISQIEDFLGARTPVTDKFFYNLYTVSPEAYLRYETNKDNSSASVTLVTNREDIIIDGPISNEYEFTFYENGSYKIYCYDWFNNYNESFNVEITSIVEKPAPNIFFYISIFVTSLIFCVSTGFIIAKQILSKVQK